MIIFLANLGTSDYAVQRFRPEPLWHPLVALFWFCVFWLLPLLIFALVVYCLISLPMRRQERARFFLDLLETGLARGQSSETAIVSASESKDQTLGIRFHLLAAYLETGLRLTEGLAKVTRLLPPQVVGMLAAGERLGDVQKVFPACRRSLTDGASKLMSGLNYWIVLVVVVNPAGLVIWPFLTAVIVPKFQEICLDLLGGKPLPPLLQMMVEHKTLVTVVQGALIFVMASTLLAYVMGPRGIGWLAWVTDRVAWRLPWRRKRMQRDFSAMLAVLLDAAVPEPEAVRLAAASTANRVFIRHAEVVVARLGGGLPLTDAVDELDDAGEFRWRLTNAVHARGGFMEALTGWHEALEAQAYQQEQAASQVITTALVIINGVVVGTICVGVFQVLTFVVTDLSLW